MKALKKVPGKNKGLSKLPTSVRNKMGYMKKGGKVYQDGGKAPKGERDYGSDGLVGLTLGEAERRADKEAKYSKNVKQKRTSKFNENLERERVARLKAEQSVALAEGEKGKKLRQLERQDPAAYNRVMESARQEAESEMRTRLMRRNMKKGGKVVKYQEGGKSVELPEVVVKGKKGKGLKERTVVGRGMSGEDYLKRRAELQAEYTDAFYRKNNRMPGSKIRAIDKSTIDDKVRMQLQKEGMTEQGVTSKETGKRLSPEMEQQYRDRTNRR